LKRNIRPCTAQLIHPAHLAEQTYDLPKRNQNANKKTANDQAIQAGVCHKKALQILRKNHQQETAEQQKNNHADQEAPWWCQLERISMKMRFRHDFFSFAFSHHALNMNMSEFDQEMKLSSSPLMRQN
jgi:hypothetical protein